MSTVDSSGMRIPWMVVVSKYVECIKCYDKMHQRDDGLCEACGDAYDLFIKYAEHLGNCNRYMCWKAPTEEDCNCGYHEAVRSLLPPPDEN